jgi:predicted N-acyltransferase
MTRTPRALQVVLAEKLSHLEAARWDALTKDAGVFLQRPFLSALEAAAPDNVSPRYALFFDGDKAVAALVLQLVRIEGRSALAHAPLAQFVDERALVLGNLAAWGATGIATTDRRVVPEALKLLDRIRRFEKSEGVVNMALVKDVTPTLDELEVRKAGYQRAPSGVDMQLRCEPEWTSLDGYLASLAAKRRRAVKKTVEEVEAAGYCVRRLSLEDVQREEARLDSLYGQVWANAEVRPLKLTGRFFVELQKRMGDDCIITALEKDGRIDGFAVSLKNGDDCVGYYLGYDKSVAAPLYLRLLLAMLERAFEWGSRHLSLGRTCEDTKARLGAVPVSTQLWLKHRTPPMNWAVGAILGAMEQAPVPIHRVFRELPHEV